MNRLDKIHEFEDRICDALVLGFGEEPIKYDYYIPQVYDARQIIIGSFKDCLGSRKEGYDDRRARKVFGKKVSEGLYRAVFEIHYSGPYSDATNYFSNFYLGGFGNERIFCSEWFADGGELKKFREGEREKAEERVEKYFTEFQLGRLNVLQEAIQRNKSEWIKENVRK
jgi:hypothetical protein